MQSDEVSISQIRIADSSVSGSRAFGDRLAAVVLAMTLATGLSARAAEPAATATTNLQPAKAGDTAVTQSVALELEDFSLTDCVVSNLTTACGGKAVLIAKESSKAETTVKLSKGEYSVTFWIMAPSLQNDTVWVTIGDPGKAGPWEGKYKAFPDHKRMPMTAFMSSGVYVNNGAKVETVVVRVTEDMKELPIVITPKKTGMLIDRMVFQRRGDVKP